MRRESLCEPKKEGRPGQELQDVPWATLRHKASNAGADSLHSRNGNEAKVDAEKTQRARRDQIWLMPITIASEQLGALCRRFTAAGRMNVEEMLQATDTLVRLE